MCFPNHCACAMFRRVVVHAARSPRRSAELDAQANILEMWRGIWWLPLSFHLHLVITNLTFHPPIVHIQFTDPRSFHVDPYRWKHVLPTLLQHCWGKNCNWCEALHFVEIPIKDLDSSVKGAQTTMRVPMVMPHELLCYLVATWTACFVLRICFF